MIDVKCEHSTSGVPSRRMSGICRVCILRTEHHVLTTDISLLFCQLTYFVSTLQFLTSFSSLPNLKTGLSLRTCFSAISKSSSHMQLNFLTTSHSVVRTYSGQLVGSASGLLLALSSTILRPVVAVEWCPKLDNQIY